MTHISIQQVEADLQGIFPRIRDGEELILEEDGVAIGKVTPIRKVTRNRIDFSRRLGFLAGQGSFPGNWKEIGLDDMDAALDRIDRL